MKKVILLIWLMPFPALCQISENFESGIISQWMQSPASRWTAEKSYALSGSYSLHHSYDNSEAGSDQIGIPLLNLRPAKGTTRWSFMVKHGYEPSSSNNWAVFLMTDNGPAEMHPGGNINGYAIGVNLTGYDDTLRLWKIKQGMPISIIAVPVNWQNNIGITSAAKIEVERSLSGVWKIKVSNLAGLTIGTATRTEVEIFTTGWFGIFYKYTSTRDRLLWLDEIVVDGVFIADTTPPSVTNLTVDGRNSVEITLDEEPSAVFTEVSNFTTNNNAAKATGVLKKDHLTFLVIFSEPFINKEINSLAIKKICDDFLNCRESILINFTPVWAEAGDVVISEIMADPWPAVALPVAEFMELKNKTSFLINLTNWKLISESQTVIFPGSEIFPGENLIICHVADTMLFSKYGKVTGFRSFPVLTDDGRYLVVCDSSGQMIHGAEYSKEWYGDILKSEGGWSLEMIDVSHPFNTENNWKASVSRTGGTPGKTNSVTRDYPDISFKGIKNAFPVDDSTVIVTFSEPVKNMSVLTDKVMIDEKTVQSAYPVDMLNRKFVIRTGEPLVTGQIFTLSVPSALSDYSGNRIEKRIARFGIPEISIKNDIVFNELMFNPSPGFPDYIELANNSGKTIDASSLFIVTVDDVIRDTSVLVPVSEEPRCILPGALYTITTNREDLLSRYITSSDTNIFEVSRLPSMYDDDGHLLLFNRQLDLLDEVRYNDQMHFALLSGTEGVSLEKVRPESSSSDIKNWHSASEASGWGTPGAPNSNFTDTNITGDKMEFFSSRLSPDNDGYEDLLVMDFSLAGYGNILSINIFDEGGNLVKKLAQNLLAGPHASITWDGTADDGMLVGTGVYIVLVSVFDDKGKTQKWKRVCTVIR